MKNTIKKAIATVAAIAMLATATAETIKAASTQVYRTPSGKKYHVSAKCGGANSYATSLDEVLVEGKLEPCGKCCKKQISRVEYDADGVMLEGATLVTEIPTGETWTNDAAAYVVYTAKDGTTTKIER